MKGEIMLSNYSYAYPMPKAPTGRQMPTSDISFSKTSALPENPKLAMSYVPFQTDMNTYDENKALKAGTLFPCLDKPFLGSGTR